MMIVDLRATGCQVDALPRRGPHHESRHALLQETGGLQAEGARGGPPHVQISRRQVRK